MKRPASKDSKERIRKRRQEIIFETEQRVTLRRFGAPPVARCAECSGLMVFAAQAVATSGLID